MHGSPLLIAADGDVRGLLACASVAAERGPGHLVWCPSSGDGPSEASETRLQAAREHAAVYEHRFLESDPGPPEAASAGELQTRLLLEAGFLARRHGAAGVLWGLPNAGTGEDPLREAAAAQSRATLVSRLVALENSEAEFTVRMPYIDLTGRQLADLILDMDLPIWTCWWWPIGRGPRNAPGFAEARAEYQRWEALLREAGWTEGMPGPAAVEGA